MKPLRALALYLAVVFLGGALLAPVIHRLVQSHGPAWLASQPFHRFVNRSLLIVALGGLWPLIRALGFSSVRECGLVAPAPHLRWIGRGLALGFATLAVAAAAGFLAGAVEPRSGLVAPVLQRKILEAAGTAILVAFLEELLFRGVVLGGLEKALPPTIALVVSSAIYSLVHFFQPVPRPDSVGWLSGLAVLAQMCAGFVNLRLLIPGFFNLFLAGLILGRAYQGTRTLWFSFGIHAGWIFWLKLYGSLTQAHGVAPSWFWGSPKLIDGWAALGVLAAAAWVAHRGLGTTAKSSPRR